MSHRISRIIAIVLAAVVGFAPLVSEAGPSSDNLLELAAKGGPAVGLSLGVSPLRFDVLGPPEPAGAATVGDNGLLGERERGRAVSFDIKLRWPTADLPFEPYLVLGPALLVEGQDMSGLTGVPPDPVVRLGAKAGAGFSWKLGKDAQLFGSYDVTTGTADRYALPQGRASSAPGGSFGYDLLYGVRFGF
jgi:hypothetical protein